MTAVVAGLTIVGGITAAGASPNAPEITELPPVTISTTTLRVGETVSISGTGCVDPESGTGDGLEVVLYVPRDEGRGGGGVRPAVRADADTDGSFAGSGVIEQPSFPDGAQTGFFICQEKSQDGFSSIVAQREVQLIVEAPSLPDLVVTAGATADYVLPCSIVGGEYGFFSIAGSAAGLDDVYLNVGGSFPEDSSPQEGDQVQLKVPADATPGVYAATATCGVTESGTSAYFAGFTLTVTAGPSTTTTTTSTPVSPPAPAPAPATPVASAPNFTG